MTERHAVTLGLDPAHEAPAERLLREMGYARQTAPSAEACLPMLEQEARTLLLIDLDAFELQERFFERLREKNRSCAVIVLSSRSYHPELSRAMRNTIFATLRKPWKEEELRICLQALGEREERF